MTDAGRSNRRGVGFGILATVALMAGLALARTPASAASSIQPTELVSGLDVTGVVDGAAGATFHTSVAVADLDGIPAKLFTLAPGEQAEPGATYDESGWTAQTDAAGAVIRILTDSDAALTGDPAAIAAAQAAIWHLTTGFELDPKSNPEAIMASYSDLIDTAISNPLDPDQVAGDLTLAGPETAPAGHPVFLEVTGSVTGRIRLEASDPSASIRAVAGDGCGVTPIEALDGAGRFCVLSPQALSGVVITARADASPVQTGRIFSGSAGHLVTASTTSSQATAMHTIGWSENLPPSVKVSCPSEAFVFGEPAHFEAAVSDPEEGPVSIEWLINGRPVKDATQDAIDIALASGDHLTVRATDDLGQVATAETLCGGFEPATTTPATTTAPPATTTVPVPAENHPPTVVLDCPPAFVFGTPVTYTAHGEDPEGGPLTYRWYLNDALVADQNNSTIELTISEGDRVAVVAVDTNNAESESAAVSCAGEPDNRPPTVTIACPEVLVYDEPTSFTASGSDPDGDPLTYVWTLNGEVVGGATTATSSITVHEGDHLSVTAIDAHGAKSDAVESTCKGHHRPTVALQCPDNLVLGEEIRVTAVGSDLDGGPLTYSWSVGGKAILGATGPTARVTIQAAEVLSVTVVDATSLSSSASSSPCVGGHRPEVSLNCPSTLIYGEAATFTAVGHDEDGDTLTYTWAVNGRSVAAQTGPVVTLILNRGDRVTVTATDPTHLATAETPVQCPGRSRPTIALECPTSLDFTKPVTLGARGVDADGDALTFTWTINKTVVADATGDHLTALLKPDDAVTVQVTDASGLTNRGLTALRCAGTITRTVKRHGTTPSTQPASTPNLAVTESPGQLTTVAETGVEHRRLLGAGLASLGVGLGLLGLSRRRGLPRSR